MSKWIITEDKSKMTNVDMIVQLFKEDNGFWDFDEEASEVRYEIRYNTVQAGSNLYGVYKTKEERDKEFDKLIKFISGGTI